MLSSNPARRVSIATDDLNLLDSMTFGIISFKELLGHCNEVYKKNQSDLTELELRLKDFGYSLGTISRSIPVWFLVSDK